MDGMIKQRPILMQLKKIQKEKMVKIALKMGSFQFKKLN